MASLPLLVAVVDSVVVVVVGEQVSGAGENYRALHTHNGRTWNLERGRAHTKGARGPEDINYVDLYSKWQ